MAIKSQTIGPLGVNVPTSWDTYIRDGFGNYGFLASGSGTGRKNMFYSRNRTWHTLLGWKAFRAANGYLPTQPYTDIQDRVVQDGSVSVYYYLGGSYKVVMKSTDPVYVPNYSGVHGSSGPMVYSTAEKDRYVADAKSKCLAKARDMKVSLPVMLGEGRQTVNMLAETARLLGRSYRNFRRGRFRQAAKELGIPTPSGTASNHWLAYNYGWMPLLSDAKGLYELATKGLGHADRGPRMTFSASAKTQKDYKGTTVGQGASNLPGGETKQEHTTRLKAKAALLVEFKSSYWAGQSLGLGRYDPLLTAWELTPFSFVFDWFIDIGGYLENLSSLDGMTVLAGYESVHESVEGTSTMTIPGNAGWVEGKLPTAKYRWRSYSRADWTGSVPVLRTPLWDGLNARRLITTAALWRQRCRGDRVPGKYRP